MNIAIGNKYGRLVIIDKSFRYNDSGRKIRQWIVQCNCGTVKRIDDCNIRSGTKSCGCLQKELAKKPKYKKHGMAGTPEYSVWCSMRSMCLNKNNKKYPHYGGRGITICDEWKNFVSFYNDLGPRPDGYILGRIDIDKNYTPDNTRWLTQPEQQNKRRNGKIIYAFGKSQSLKDWSIEVGIDLKVISNRLNNLNWTAEEALTVPNKGTGFKKMKGKRFGKLKVLQRSSDSAEGKTQFYCKCDCGNTTITRAVSLRMGLTKSCGCLRHKNPKLWDGYCDISGCYWNNFKREAAIRKKQFNITIEEAWDLFIYQNKKCALSGVELCFVSDYSRDKRNQTASLDRIDSSKDYTVNNVQWVHKDLNMIKNKYGQKEFINWCKLVANYIKTNE